MTDLSLAGLSATQIADLVRAQKVSAVEVVSASLERIRQVDPLLRSFTALRASEAIAEAKVLDSGGLGQDAPLAGVPVAVKEEYDVQGLVTTLGGVANSTPARSDSEAIRRLRAAGAIIVGKTAMPEFGQFPDTFTHHSGVTLNPWNREYSPGGSSGGSAAAVAARLVPLALGSDGGGSIRIPASCCGLIGLKPERGRISLAPLTDHWYGLVSLGVLSRTVADTALAYDVIAGPMPADRWRARPWTQSLSASLAVSPERLRIGWTARSVLPGLGNDPGIDAALADLVLRLESLGHTVTEAPGRWPIPTDSFLIRFFAGMHTEAALVEHPARLSRHTRRSAGVGRLVPSGLLRAAVRRGRRVATALNDRFLTCHDVLLVPTMPRLVPRAGYLTGRGTVDALLRSTPYVANTAIFNVSGHPALSIPAGLSSSGLPIGMQLVSRPGQEGLLLALAAELEADRSWPRPPDLT